MPERRRRVCSHCYGSCKLTGKSAGCLAFLPVGRGGEIHSGPHSRFYPFKELCCRMAKSTSEENLAKLFGSVSRARILVLLFAHMDRRFYQREIMYETGLSLQPVQRELANFVDLGIIRKQETPNRVYYEIDQESSLFKPLRETCKFAPRQRD